MSFPVCPCDLASVPAPLNLPGLDQIAFRIGNYVSFRQAVLTPLFVPATPDPLPIEQTLSNSGVPVWRAQSGGDLAVMIAEWFAIIGDIIAFYNERIANEDYLRTALLPESVNNLIALLGYRPRPAIGATATLAALLSPGPSFGGQPITLPQGLQFQSKPTPGQPPQIFELSQATENAAPDRFPAAPPPVLLRESTLLLQGAVKNIDPGALLLLRARDTSLGGPWLAKVTAVSIGPAPSGGGQQTTLTMTLSASPPASLSAAEASLEAASQNTAPWSFNGSWIGSDLKTVQLASLVRQIRPGDWLLFTAAGGSPAPQLAQVSTTADVITDVVVDPSGKLPPLPIPNTQLTLASPLPGGWSSAVGVAIAFNWISVGVPLDQPFAAWTGTPANLVGTGPAPFPAWSGQNFLLQDATGLGIAAQGSSKGDSNLALVGLPDPVPSLQPPFLVLPNLLAVTRGKTVRNEVLGSGDPTNPAQDFQLSQSPVTYLQQGSGYASTITLTVNGLPWTEVSSFYGQPPDATVFATREGNQGKTHVMFGDGVNGARLPGGVNNVIASYRVGAGAASPPAGKLTVLANPYPGLNAVLNPLAAGGGADADPPSQIRRFAPRSVLTFGRAVSVFDFQALAASVPSVTRAAAVWGWDDAQQRAMVRVYVGDNPAAAAAASTALQAAGDPNRPVKVTAATAVSVALTFTLLFTPGVDTNALSTALRNVLSDSENGLFGASNIGIGQTVFLSQIEAAILAVQGAVALTALAVTLDGVTAGGPILNPGEGAYFTLDPSGIMPTLVPANTHD